MTTSAQGEEAPAQRLALLLKANLSRLWLPLRPSLLLMFWRCVSTVRTAQPSCSGIPAPCGRWADGYEYLAGTDPNNGNSKFRLTIQRTGATGKEVSFVAQATAGNGYQSKVRTYTLEWTTNLNSNTWTPLTGYIGVMGAGQTVRYPVPPQGPATVFYRAVIQLNDVEPPLPQ